MDRILTAFLNFGKRRSWILSVKAIQHEIAVLLNKVAFL